MLRRPGLPVAQRLRQRSHMQAVVRTGRVPSKLWNLALAFWLRKLLIPTVPDDDSLSSSWPDLITTSAGMTSQLRRPWYQTKTPAVSCRGLLFQALIRRTGLPVALGAQPQDPSVLVRERVESCRLANAEGGCSQACRTSVLLIQMGVGNFGPEGQVLDRGPSGDETQLRNVVVGVAGGYPRTKGKLGLCRQRRTSEFLDVSLNMTAA